ncbi:unnamed protein product [Ectocarpus sp. 8 AP-2014]
MFTVCTAREAAEFVREVVKLAVVCSMACGLNIEEWDTWCVSTCAEKHVTTDCILTPVLGIWTGFRNPSRCAGCSCAKGLIVECFFSRYNSLMASTRHVLSFIH